MCDILFEIEIYYQINISTVSLMYFYFRPKRIKKAQKENTHYKKESILLTKLYY